MIEKYKSLHVAIKTFDKGRYSVRLCLCLW